jgi:hypothetical protein
MHRASERTVLKLLNFRRTEGAYFDISFPKISPEEQKKPRSYAAITGSETHAIAMKG